MDMKNKNGFTLIELLGVIIIIGVILMIAVPTVSKNINTATKKTYMQHEKSMEEAATNMMNECVEKNGDKCNVPNSDEKLKLYLSEMVDKGYLNELKDPEGTKEVGLCDKNSSYVTINNISKSEGNYSFSYDVCLKCSNYESGYCSKKEEEMDCSKAGFPSCGENLYENTLWTNKDVTIGTKCNASSGTKCTQEIFYKTFNKTTPDGKGQITITNTCGKSTTCEADVYIDKAKPTCELITEGGVLGENGWYRDDLKVRLSSKVDAQSGIATFGLGTSKKADYNKKEVIDVPDGISIIYGYVKDRAGNENVCKIEVKKDTGKPVIEEVELGYQVYPKDDISTTNNSVVSLNDITSEYGLIYGVKIYLKNASINSTTIVSNGSDELSKRTIGSGVKLIEHTFSGDIYENIKIDLGNTNTLNDVSRIELITKETTGFYTNENVTIYPIVSDSISSNKYFSYENGSYTTNNSYVITGNKNVAIKLKDIAGNESDVKSIKVDNIDKLDPYCELKKTGSMHLEDWYRSDVEVSFNVKDDQNDNGTYAKSSVRDYSFNVNGVGNPKSKIQNTDTDGQGYTGYVVDKAGNVSSCSVTVKRDTVKPTCEISLTGTKGTNDWYKEKNVAVKLSKKEDDRSTLDTYGLTVDTAITYNKKIDDTQANTSGQTWYGYVRDKAGNENKCDKFLKVDTTKPTCSPIAKKSTASGSDYANSTWYGGNVYTSASCTDGLSGCSSKKTLTTTGATTNVVDKEEASWTVQANNKSYLNWRTYDNAGNSKDCSQIVAWVDKVKPTVTWSWVTSTGRTTDVYGSTCYTSVTYKATCADSYSGVASGGGNYKISNVGTSSSASTTCTDKVGNQESFTSPGVRICYNSESSICGARSCRTSACGCEKSHCTAYATTKYCTGVADTCSSPKVVLTGTWSSCTCGAFGSVNESKPTYKSISVDDCKIEKSVTGTEWQGCPNAACGPGATAGVRHNTYRKTWTCTSKVETSQGGCLSTVCDLYRSCANAACGYYSCWHY